MSLSLNQDSAATGSTSSARRGRRRWRAVVGYAVVAVLPVAVYATITSTGTDLARSGTLVSLAAGSCPPITATLAGSTPGSANGNGTGAQFNGPLGVAVDAGGNVYVADTFNNRIRKIAPGGAVTSLAAAEYNRPVGVAVDAAGNVYVGDTFNNRIRKIAPDGAVTTLAGAAGTTLGGAVTHGFADGTGTAAKFDSPQGVAVDAAGNVYVGDSKNHRIRKITPSGAVTTLAGSTLGFADGTGTAAKFSNPNGVAVDAAGNVYVGDWGNHRIRKIAPDGAVTTLAGSTAGFADSIDSGNAQFNFPSGVAVDAAGIVYVAERDNHRIRKIRS
jgi:sugar lactone lactonase YvrE